MLIGFKTTAENALGDTGMQWSQPKHEGSSSRHHMQKLLGNG